MGSSKQQKRRKREKNRAERARQAARARRVTPQDPAQGEPPAEPLPEPSVVVEFPSGCPPLLRLVIEPGTPEDLHDLCVRYWSLDEDGKWRERVSDITRDPHSIAARVRDASYALTLAATCQDCGEPHTVRTRSHATQLAGAYLDRVGASGRCQDCAHHAEQLLQQQKAAQRAAQQAEQEAARQQAMQEQQLIEEALQAQALRQAPEDLYRVLPGSAHALILYYAMLSLNMAAPSQMLPSSTEAGPTGWMSALEDDYVAVGYLLKVGAAIVDPATPRDRFTVNSDDDVRCNHATVNLRLTHVPHQALEVFHNAVRFLHGPGEATAAAREQLDEALLALEIDAVIHYLDSLLEKKYNYPPTPVARRPELVQTIRDGYAANYTLGQMICLAWRAADTAAAWKERNTGMGPPEASSATVTSLRTKLTNVRERRLPVPEYDMPRWIDMPLALPAAQHVYQLVRAPWSPELIKECTACDAYGWAYTDQNRTYRCAHPPEDSHARASSGPNL